MTGSSNWTPARRAASCSAMDPAILKAMSDESTAWEEPSTRMARTLSIGYPARTPESRASSMPESTAADVLAGDGPTPGLVDELVAAAGVGLEVDDHVAVLAVAAGLLDVAALDAPDGLADRLPVGHLGPADVGVRR